jgi:alanine-glyoxylate transaminase/serine-glyoxylate transaminase/serine-pyruvate transaminase
LIQKYWGPERVYHHTAPANMIYALNEGLRIVKEEGLEARFARHKAAQKVLIDGLQGMGLKMVVNVLYRLPSLTTVYVPEGVDETAVRKKLLDEHNIEIGAGFGVFKGKIWRVGLMGTNATKADVVHLLAALKDVMGR